MNAKVRQALFKNKKESLTLGVSVSISHSESENVVEKSGKVPPSMKDSTATMLGSLFGATLSGIEKARAERELSEYSEGLVDEQKAVLQLMKREARLGYTNQRLLRFELIRLKICAIAADLRYTSGQLWIVAIFKTVLEWPDDEGEDLERKYASLTRILKIVTKSPPLEDLTQVLDTPGYHKIERAFNKHTLMKIKKMTPRSKQHAMLAFVRRINRPEGIYSDDGSVSSVELEVQDFNQG